MPEPVPTPVVSAVQKKAAKEQFALAVRLLNQSNYADAIHLIRECCRLDPTDLGLRRALRRAEQQAVKSGTGWLGKAALKTKRKMAKLRQAHMEVLELGESLLALDPADIPCQLEMAESALALGLAELALWILMQARQQESSDAVNLALAQVFEQMGEFQKAIAMLQQISPAYHDHAELQRRIKDLMANDSIRRTTDAQTGEAGPSVIDTDQVNLAESTKTDQPLSPVSVERYARDIEKLRSRIAADPGNVNQYLALVDVLRRAGQLKECREVLRQGLAATSNHPELNLAVADLKIELKRLQLGNLEKQLKANPADATLRRGRAEMLQEITRSELQFYRQRVQYQPAEVGPRFEMAVRLYRTGQFQEGVRELQVTRESPRYQWQSLAYLGLCFEKLQVWPLAQRNLKDALEKLPADENDWRKRILFHLAQGTAASGELEEAIQLGYELANLDFTYREIDRLIAQWRQQQSEKE